MSLDLGPLPYDAQYFAVINPANSAQVRQVTGTPAWVDTYLDIADVVTAVTAGIDGIPYALLADGILDDTDASYVIYWYSSYPSLVSDYAGIVVSDPQLATDTQADTITTQTTAAAINAALLDEADAIETGLTVRKAWRLICAVLGGKLSGASTTTEVFRNAVQDSKTRITATVDASGNRSAITTDLT
jgi:hypothetical protein